MITQAVQDPANHGEFLISWWKCNMINSLPWLFMQINLMEKTDTLAWKWTWDSIASHNSNSAIDTSVTNPAVPSHCPMFWSKGDRTSPAADRYSCGVIIPAACRSFSDWRPTTCWPNKMLKPLCYVMGDRVSQKGDLQWNRIPHCRKSKTVLMYIIYPPGVTRNLWSHSVSSMDSMNII